jgi:hypothetical protein
MKIYSEPVVGIPIGEPIRIPNVDEIIIGYEIVNLGDGFLTSPQPEKMNYRGWCSVFVLLFVFWPCSCLPCVLSCSYDAYQRPVYGYIVDKVKYTYL